MAPASSLCPDPRRGWCGGLVNAAKWVPVLFITTVVVWSYYAYVLQLCFFTVESWWERLVMLLLYHVFFTLFVWSYWRTVFTTPGNVPSRFFLSAEDMDAIESSDNQKAKLEQIVVGKDLPCTMRSIQGEIRYCSECSLIKPDRVHHCGVCGKCVLKMDHHCPWVNNCVAFKNYKFFILFLGYALLYCMYVALSSLKYFLAFWTSNMAQVDGKFHVLFLFFVSAMFSISLASLFFYHCYLVSRNMTTLEAFRTPVFRTGPDKLAFHLGKYNNFQEVFGDNRWTWFLPVFTSFGDGLVYPQRREASMDDEEAGLLLRSTSPTAAVGGGIGVIGVGGATNEERMPMMRHHSEDEDETIVWGTDETQQHVTSSSSSPSSGGGASAAASASAEGRSNGHAHRPGMATTSNGGVGAGSSSNSTGGGSAFQQHELVSVDM